MSFENERYEAEVSLQTGVNLVGRCSSGGVCNYVLSADGKCIRNVSEIGADVILSAKPLFAPGVKVL